RPLVAREQAARLGIDVVAVQPHERPFLGLHADRVEPLRPDAELVELANGVGLKVDTYAERLRLGASLEHDASHADLMQCEGDAQSADAAAGNDDRRPIRFAHVFRVWWRGDWAVRRRAPRVCIAAARTTNCVAKSPP